VRCGCAIMILLALPAGRSPRFPTVAGVASFDGGGIDDALATDFVPVNTADDWLHLVLGIGMIGLGLA
jgi:hypothetical protein